MSNPAVNRLDAVLGRWLPEQRLFLKSDRSARFLRITPTAQTAILGGAAALVGWSLLAGSVLVSDALDGGTAQARLDGVEASVAQRLADLTAERDARAAEAAALERRFALALDQVSRMQSQLLAADERTRELEAGVESVRASLTAALDRRDAAPDQAGPDSSAPPVQEVAVALDILSGELTSAATEKASAERKAAEAQRAAEAMAVERDAVVARNDEILTRLEDAVEQSVKPLDEMFRKVGVDGDELLETVRDGYSGQGGPLTPMGYSSRGNAAISESEARATEIVVSLGKISNYRTAVSKLPLAMPVKSAFRYSSGYGRRWGRAHEGIDMAGPVGTPIYATGDGVVTFAGWQRGYGNIIKISHEMGTETRYGHLSKIKVRVGQKVSRNSLIGAMGNTGRSTGPHLHYEVRVNGRAVDPMSFIKAAQNVF